MLLTSKTLSAEPLVHSVFFDLKSTLTPEQTSDFKIEALKLGEIPDVENLRWLEELSAKNPYSYGLKMEFSDQAAFQRYHDHPDHREFVEQQWKKQVESFVEIDYRDQDSRPSGTIDLLDPDLSHWEKWIGVPHASVQGLPDGVEKSENIAKGTPLGLSDPKQVFTTAKDEEGNTVLQVSGEIYGGLTTRSEFANYHLTLQFKWGEKKWAPRLKKKRDSGLLYHCYGDHGAMWKVWKRSLELQIQEGDFGDLFRLAGATATTTTDEKGAWHPQGSENTKGSVRRSRNLERPHGQWNTIDLYVLGDQAVHVINGEVVLALSKALTHQGQTLEKGQIQLQSEGAECFYKNIRLSPISRFPSSIADAIR